MWLMIRLCISNAFFIIVADGVISKNLTELVRRLTEVVVDQCLLISASPVAEPVTIIL